MHTSTNGITWDENVLKHIHAQTALNMQKRMDTHEERAKRLHAVAQRASGKSRSSK